MSVCGTPEYIAPEVLLMIGHTENQLTIGHLVALSVGCLLVCHHITPKNGLNCLRI